jgi:fatty-acyl-CoA synthase
MTPASPLTLAERVERAADSGGAITFAVAGDRDRVPWARLHEDSRAFAAGLQSLGIGPGDHVCILGPTSRELVTGIQATWLTGAAVVVLPLPMRLGSIGEFVSQTRARIRSADASLVLVDAELEQFLELSAGDPPVALLGELAHGPGRPEAGAYDPPRPDPAALAVLQFTSGSTADPKGVMLPHAQVCTNLDGIAEAALLDTEADRVVSWLPLYHDMGLIGVLLMPMTTGTDLLLAAPQDFLGAPGRWVEWMSEFKGTATAGPNFAYALAARALRRQSGIDLSSWRLALNGAEPIDPAAVNSFCEAAAAHRFDPRAAFCVFGMAEASLAVTFPTPGAGMSTDIVDRRALELELCAVPSSGDGGRSRQLAKLGRPIPGIDVRIVDPADGRPRAEREVGELEIRGSSVTPGYYKHPAATAEAFRGEWLRTGDLGYLVDGELVVCGRQKDMIIVGGRNVFPEDVERAVASVPGVRQGNVIAFGVEGRGGRERLVVVAETREEDQASLRRRVAERVRHSVGLSLEDVVLLGPGGLPKTSSGKLQRSLCRQRYLQAQLEPA